MTTEWLVLIAIVVVGVILFLALRTFSELNVEVGFFKWIYLKLIGKGRITDTPKLPAAEIGELIARYNDDFCKAVASRDIRYLSATTTPNGFAQIRRLFEDILASKQTQGWVSCHLVTHSIVGEPLYSGKKAKVTADETWEYQYASGQKARICVRNVYSLALVGKEWLIEACEVLSPHVPSA